ncbi:MAG: nucleotide exchange factor GrpE [Ruminococcus sp.]|nr:nucleotide exchange factor GrpE [Ruminococcus sp.]
MEPEIKEEVLDLEENKEEKIEHHSKKKKKVDKEKEELKEANLNLKEKVLRITADMQNMRRRYDSDLSNAYKYDGFDLIEKILPVIDNFERAMNIKLEGSEKFVDGFKMIYNNLIDILKSKGVNEIEALDQEFDPNVMNAILTDSVEEKENNIVLEVLQKGYMYNDRIIRPAMVKVNNKESE